MGIPKFFRYMSERYPCLNELVRENQIPEFDNLYLDMNGIIHNCSHPDDSDMYFRISEEQIFTDIFHYLEYLFKMIRPQKLFFIAIDGVAPRAKMNQQRGRRFCSARDAQQQIKDAEKKGQTLPEESRFDSNCITPGTSFMVRLQKALEHFIQVMVSTNPMWMHCKVILSSHATPGEGEHKIMEYIRYMKSKPDFNPNTRHCLYGLDADLIMLGLCTHEKYFSLLREEVKFGKNEKKSTVPAEIRFYLLHLTLFREYLELEFEPIRNKLSFKFDIYKLIDDWVLMGFMVGNDFIPHLPHLHINENAIPTLIQVYMEILPTLDGYINEGGILNLARLQVFMGSLARFDRNIFMEHYSDLKFFNAKCGTKNAETFDVTIDDIKTEAEMNYDLSALIRSTEEMYGSSDEGEEDSDAQGDIENDPEFFEKEFNAYKRNYYITKMGYAEFDEEVRAEQTECYIKAIQWILYYYYQGVPSWSWFYPHHYAPFISDIYNFKHLVPKYNIAKPFLPFQQLLSVLPAASKDHLPSAYHRLMTEPDSPIIDYYPVDFETDLNGKKQTWEAVVLIPFIEENRLLAAMELCDAFLTDEEKQRNVHGPMIVYEYDKASTDQLPACYGFESIDRLKVRKQLINRDTLHVQDDKIVRGPTKGALLDGYIQGFPTFKHLAYHGTLKEVRVKVFNFPSRNKSMVVHIDRPLDEMAKTTQVLAQEMLDRVVYVSWPHLVEAKVVKVQDAQMIYTAKASTANNGQFFNTCMRSIVDHHFNRLAIDLGEITQLVSVKTCIGSEYVLKNNCFVLRKLWNSFESMYPIQSIVTEVNEVLKTLKPYIEIHQMYPENSVVFLRATQWYGSLGHVIEVTPNPKRIKTRFEIYSEPDLEKIVVLNEVSKQQYKTMMDAAACIGISINLLSRISSSIFIVHGARRSLNMDEQGKVNIGLQIRNVTRNEHVVGYTQKLNDKWMFSEKAIELLKSFYGKAPVLFERLEVFGRTDVLFESEMFAENSENGSQLKELVAWLKTQPHTKAERRSCGSKMLEPTAFEALIKLINDHREKTPIIQTMFVHPSDLFKPEMKKAKTIDPKADHELLDRVIVAQDTEIVPLGTRGTIIGIHVFKDVNSIRQERSKEEDKYFDVLLDKEHQNGSHMFGIEASDKRVIRLAENAILNISYGTADYECKQIDTTPMLKSAEELVMKPSTSMHPPAQAIAYPAKPPPTAESIKKRLNERIEKKDPTKAFVFASQNQNNPSMVGQNGPPNCNFELLWKKLRDNAQAPSYFDERDIKSFLAKESIPATASMKNIPLAAHASAVPINNDPTDMLKKMLKISGDHHSLSGGTGSINNAKVDSFVPGDVLMNVPVPENLPKPPLSWKIANAAAGIEAPGNNLSQSAVISAHMANNVPIKPNPFLAALNNSSMPNLNSMACQTGHRLNTMILTSVPAQIPNIDQRGPIGPQNLSFNRNVPAGTGAFVPLQALKKQRPLRSGGGGGGNAKQNEIKQKQSKTRKTNNSNEERSKQDEANPNRDVKPATKPKTKKPPSSTTNSTANDAAESSKTNKPVTQKQPKERKMKIAANFAQPLPEV
ncbi:5'-3' exoribonuclease 1-like isoform X2 [Uranotaenia lowii]|uniref:5'-3' exoribonuclease 1-like isoform X2 n=2 Tax=Uranotaenia lowii TaxID=190385 RepID=UPI002479DC9A|nr:5'-3' exoribonuclease 1-like isoform X2 [Uranotaenia lowii]